VNPKLEIGFVGPHVAVLPEPSLRAAPAVDWVARSEFDFSVVEIAEGRPLDSVDGVSFRRGGEIVHTPERATVWEMDRLPHVIDVYRRDLRIEDYEIGEARYPFISLYTGRGCKSRCTFCLWPQTIGGHKYRVRSPEHVYQEIEKGTRYFPQVREYFFDDDTLTDNIEHVEGVARKIGPLLKPRGMTWSCNAKANVPYETLSVLKENGLRLTVVGYETGDQQILHNIKKGMRIEVARRYTEDCHKLGIKIHGTFIMGLPGETRETIRETIRFAKEMNPHTIQVSLPAAYPGTFLYEQAKKEGWMRQEPGEMVAGEGFQVTSIEYPHLSHDEIFAAVEDFYRKFYFRPRKIAGILGEMLTDWGQMKRRLREGLEFMSFLRQRENRPTTADASA
jgi:hopanoid biosynthesis associated radical SAM protein HpnJ